MANRLTDAQARNVREQALRALRRVERSLDTRIEVMERRMDRSIENKEKITMGVLVSIIKDYVKVIFILRVFEKALASAAIVFRSVG